MKEHFYYVTFFNQGQSGYGIFSCTHSEFPFDQCMNWLKLAAGPDALILTWQKITEGQAEEINGYFATPRLPETRFVMN